MGAPIYLDQTMKTYVDKRTKERSVAALRALGISVPKYLRMCLIYMAAEKKLPFDIEIREYLNQEVAAE